MAKLGMICEAAKSWSNEWKGDIDGRWVLEGGVAGPIENESPVPGREPIAART